MDGDDVPEEPNTQISAAENKRYVTAMISLSLHTLTQHLPKTGFRKSGKVHRVSKPPL